MTTLLLVFIASLFVPGLINKTQVIIMGRKGASLFQPVFDIIKLFRKEEVLSSSASLITSLGSIIYFSTVFLALFFLPFGQTPGLFSFEGDFIFLIYALTLGRFFMIIGALDSGSSFQGMGASREALYGLLIEPAFFLIMGTLSFFSHETTLFSLFDSIAVQQIEYLYWPIIVIIAYILIRIAMIENSRMPLDDPKTHLELTMIHEVMVLDLCGFDLALIEIAGILKMVFFGTLIANLLFLPEFSLFIQIVILFSVFCLMSIVIAILESFRARVKMDKNPSFLLRVCALSLLIFFLFYSLHFSG